MSYVIYLLTSPPLRAPSVLGRTISSCPLKTIEILSLGFFTRHSAPSGLCVVVCVCVKGGLNKQRLDLNVGARSMPVHRSTSVTPQKAEKFIKFKHTLTLRTFSASLLTSNGHCQSDPHDGRKRAGDAQHAQTKGGIV